MSRLQVGGLALIIKGYTNDMNVGMTVELVEFDGSDDEWLCKSSDGLLSILGQIIPEAWVHKSRLIPLGDKQT